MQDLWSVRTAGASTEDLDDLVGYHRFLERFKVDEKERRLKDVLYEGKRFRTLAGDETPV